MQEHRGVRVAYYAWQWGVWHAWLDSGNEGLKGDDLGEYQVLEEAPSQIEHDSALAEEEDAVASAHKRRQQRVKKGQLARAGQQLHERPRRAPGPYAIKESACVCVFMYVCMCVGMLGYRHPVSIKPVSGGTTEG